MTTVHYTRKPTPPVSLAVRTCVAVGVVAMLAVIWTVAGRSSHIAVQEAQAAMNRTYVTLPRVEVAGKREPAETPVAVRTGTKRRPQG